MSFERLGEVPEGSSQKPGSSWREQRAFIFQGTDMSTVPKGPLGVWGVCVGVGGGAGRDVGLGFIAPTCPGQKGCLQNMNIPTKGWDQGTISCFLEERYFFTRCSLSAISFLAACCSVGNHV